jgi:glutathione S-transferase
MELYDNPFSPYAFKVRATLYEKQVPFELHVLRHRHQRDELLAVNPRGEVPALRDDDTVVYDSSVMCEYIEEKWPEPPLLPADPGERARCRLLERLADGPLDGCGIVAGMMKIFRPELAEKHPEVLARAEVQLQGLYARLDRELGEREFLCGAFSRADIAAAPHLLASAFIGYPVGDDLPRVKAWVERVQARPSIARATAEMLEAFEWSRTDSDPIFETDRLHFRDHRLEWTVRLGLGGWLLDEIAADRVFFSDVS